MKKSRRKKLVRNPDGTFKEWKGGRDIDDLPDKDRSNAHGVATHLGKEYKRQHGRTAKTGDIVRTKTKDGTYHKQASYYIRTPHGWRESPTEKKRPTKKTIDRVCSTARPGRPAQKPKQYSGHNWRGLLFYAALATLAILTTLKITGIL